MKSKSIVAASVLAAITASSLAYASPEYQLIFRIPLKMKIPIEDALEEWVSIDPSVYPWERTGAFADCTVWTPSVEDFPLGTDVLQTRTCDFNEKQVTISREQNTVTEEIRLVNWLESFRVQRGDEAQISKGAKGEWVETFAAFTPWEEVSAPFDVEEWVPSLSQQSSDVVQFRRYKVSESRMVQERELNTGTRDIRNIGEAFEEERIETKTQTRRVRAENTPWEKTGENENCGEWSPKPDAYFLGETFTQSRECKAQFTRTVTQYIGDDVADTFIQNQMMTVSESRSELGTNPDDPALWESFEKLVVSDWDLVVPEESRATGLWLPEAKEQLSDFLQYSDSEKKLSRLVRNQIKHKDTGEVKPVGSVYTESKWSQDGSESRNVTIEMSDWGVIGKKGGEWLPKITGQETGSFTQNISYDAEMARSRMYKAGGAIIYSAPEYKTETSVVDSRTVSLSYTDWVSVGALSECSEYTPDGAAFADNEPFIQTRNCKQKQQRTKMYSSSGTNIEGHLESQFVSVTDSRKGLGGVAIWTNTEPSCSSWLASGEKTYGDWLPLPADSPKTSYMQSREASFKETRICRNQEIREATGEIRSVGDDYLESRDSTSTENRIVNVVSSAPEWAAISYTSDWLPFVTAISPANVTQNRSFEGYKRIAYKHTLNTTGERIYLHEDLNYEIGSESRNIVKFIGQGVILPELAECGAWELPTDKYEVGFEFTQTRTCKQITSSEQKYLYKDGVNTGKLAVQLEPAITKKDVVVSQQAIGTGEAWEAVPTECGSWINGTPYQGEFSPTLESLRGTILTGAVSRYADRLQDATRTCTNREYRRATNEYRVVDSYEEKKTTVLNEKYVGQYVVINTKYTLLEPTSCPSWIDISHSVAVENKEFPKTRDCSGLFSRYTTFTANNVLLMEDSAEVQRTEQQGVYVKKVTNAKITGAETIGDWTPNAETQSGSGAYYQYKYKTTPYTRQYDYYTKKWSLFPDSAETVDYSLIGSKTESGKDVVEAGRRYVTVGSSYWQELTGVVWSPALNVDSLVSSIRQSGYGDKRFFNRIVHVVSGTSEILRDYNIYQPVEPNTYITRDVRSRVLRSWTPVGSNHTCGAWSPLASSYASGTVFTQTRSCKQDQDAEYEYYVDYTSSSYIIDGVKETDVIIPSKIYNRTTTVTESQQAVGTK